MGNCLRHESSTTWAGEDWEYLATEDSSPISSSKGDIGEKSTKIREVGLVEEDEKSFKSDSKSTTSSTEVKIKITRKQLEMLLGRPEMKEMSVQQILAQLINVNDKCETHRSRSWRPALKSIPEVN